MTGVQTCALPICSNCVASRVLSVLADSHKCVLDCVFMTQDQDWGGALHARIARAIRTARQGRLSAQQLADETERLGYGISRSQIANYESGRKKASTWPSCL